ncbi:hypothetical protein CDAR_1201 [Caerostris darwini]|uniref:Uncharacterized protein n=1 Tax=Caerostris darwini TaxID=1538125 RepID=A0AAV4SPR5_9ARAC|nr:hypothetical protein CDAR_1011 [Caerostris darwini]GIY35322.1 hypothetical protein CDAR_1201 [Caerostris darwini]
MKKGNGFVSVEIFDSGWPMDTSAKSRFCSSMLLNQKLASWIFSRTNQQNRLTDLYPVHYHILCSDYQVTPWLPNRSSSQEGISGFVKGYVKIRRSHVTSGHLKLTIWKRRLYRNAVHNQ